MELLHFHKESYLYINPMTKIIVFIFSSILMMSMGDIIIESIIILIMLLLLLNTKAYKIFIKFAVVSLMFIVIDYFVNVFNLPIILSILSKFVRMFLPTFMGFYILSKRTTSSEFMSAFNRAKLPKGIQIPFVVMLRFIPTVD